MHRMHVLHLALIDNFLYGVALLSAFISHVRFILVKRLHLFLCLLPVFFLYSQSDYERMIEKAAAAKYVNEHHDDCLDTSSKNDVYEPREPTNNNTSSDHCYTHISHVSGQDFSYSDYHFFNPVTRERYHIHEEKQYVLCAVEPPVGSETREPIIVPVEITHRTEVSLGPIVREAVNCSLERIALTLPEALVSVQEVPAPHPFYTEKLEKLDYYTPDDKFSNHPELPHDPRPSDPGDKPAVPVLKRHSSADTFAKPWRQSGINKVIKQYETLSADDFEQLFLEHTVPVGQRSSMYFDSLPVANQLFIFMQLELYQFKEFRTFLTRFPQCQSLLTKVLHELQSSVKLMRRIEKSGAYAGKNPLSTVITVITNFLSEVGALHVQQQREAQCVSMVVHQREQRVQLEKTVNKSCDLREQALQQSLDEDFLLHTTTPVVSDTVKTILQQYGLAQTFCMLERGTPIQLHLQTELLSIFEQLAQNKPEATSVKALYTTVVTTVDAANTYTLNGFIVQAIAWTDTAWSLLAYAQHCCDDARNKGIYWATRADHSFARHEYAQATAQALASTLCHALASCDYLLAAGQGAVQGTKNTAHLIYECGKTVINIDKEAVSKACNNLLTKLSASCAYLTLWDEIEWQLLVGNEAGARQKLQCLGPDVETITHAAADCLQQLKKSSNQDIVCKSFEMVTEGALLGKIVQVVHGLFAAAQVEAVSIATEQSTERTLALVQESYNLHLTSMLNTKNIMPLVDGTVMVETAQTMLPQDGMPCLYSLLLGKEFPTDVVTSAVTGVAVNGLNERSESDEQYHFPKHLRRSVLSHSPVPEDPDKDKNERKVNNMPKQEVFKQQKISDDYEKVKGRDRWKRKKGAEGLDKKVEYLEWDALHGDIEAYDSCGVHLGSYEPRSLKLYKKAVYKRTIDL